METKVERSHLLRAVDKNGPTVDINNLLDNYIRLGPGQYLIWAISFLIIATEFGEIALISILIPVLRCEWDLSVSFETALTAAIYITYFITVPIAGKVSDFYGRRRPIIVGSIVVTASGLLSAMAPNKWLFLLCRVFGGVGVGIVGSGGPLILEVTPNDYRVACVTVNMIGLYFGKLMVAVSAYLLLSLLGWRWFTAIVALPSILTCMLTTLVPESPRYLIVCGEEEKAMKSINFLAKLNGVTLPTNLKLTVYESENRGRFKDIFSYDRLRDVISLSIILGSNLCVVYGLVVYLPLALSSHVCGVSVNNSTGLRHTCTQISSSALVSLSLATLCGLVGTVLGALFSFCIGRLYPIRIATLIQIGVIFLFYFCFNMTSVNLSVAVFITGIVNCIEWIIIAEVFPTKVRATSISVVNCFGKVGGIIGSSLVYVLLYSSPVSLVTLFLMASVTCFVGTMILDKETKNLLLSDVDEG